MAAENINEQPLFVPYIGWCRAVAERPYYHDLNTNDINEVLITIRIDQLPPPTNYTP